MVNSETHSFGVTPISHTGFPYIYRVCDNIQNFNTTQFNYRLAATTYDSRTEYERIKTYNIGKLTVICRFWGARKWKQETPSLCCSRGGVNLNILGELLRHLYNGQSEESNHFLNIRKYNSCFQMTSFVSKSPPVRYGEFMPTFKVQGQVYHKVSSLYPEGCEITFD
eukprot:GHVR01061146.1.p1 GENE.GHVR01061146.1~~GHVR01061146.1.p1  ORF type:complete len:167 (-),score=11.11 GHVR01061146.1:132-632(-)